ncbi:hypothetical protein I545_3461 [Mycobacterium kansasii 662]|uniref:Uncharacterized protein n=2 Tax=Mycobacterium kansasii TaxID=1768 RepID=A0A1V3WTP8_MYCKA|nr:hypothetical protein I545_3461 [Mycobacterium kansasii 662]KEP41385.1 hypothetical protein MKSMC1_34760 [Mycobacterium kansasii]OOK70300.1 hypothetical protein BZL30_6335 [Mycobacterium kansasii]OOK75100.1 hypothetical protein BZL29_4364 [Mycobacterium kansasii]
MATDYTNLACTADISATAVASLLAYPVAPACTVLAVAWVRAVDAAAARSTAAWAPPTATAVG